VVINGTVASDHCDPWTKRGRIAQRVKFLKRVQKDVLHKIVNFSSRHTRQQDPMHERSIKIVETREPVSIAVEHCSNKHHFDRRLLRLLGGGVCLRARQKHVYLGVHLRFLVLSLWPWFLQRESGDLRIQDLKGQSQRLKTRNTD
jgi:hypothetical protein